MSYSDVELAAIIDAQLSQAIGGNGAAAQRRSSDGARDDLSGSQADAWDKYYGRPNGTEIEGRSQVVTREVLETVEWIMPSLMRVFASGQQVVRFEPESADDEPLAQDETRAVNYVATKDNNWFLIASDWFKDALVAKNGYVKVWWDVEKDIKESVELVPEEGLIQLSEDPDIEIAEATETAMDAIDPITGPIQIPAYQLRIKRTIETGRVRFECVPQEEIRVARNTNSVSLDETAFVAHVANKTRSDLIEQGYDAKQIHGIYDQAAANDELANARESITDEDEDGQEAADEAMQELEVAECYIRIDDDGDGVAELRKVVKVGKNILENEPAEIVPFEALTPIPVPHNHTGLSESDLVEDIQDIKTALTRGILDNLYLTNNPEREVLERAVVDWDDWETSIPGGLKRVLEPGASREITVPFVAGSSIPFLERLEGMQEARTGVSRQTMGLDADALAQSTRGAYTMATNSANQRLELIARTFAETGVKGLFRKIHRTLIRNQQEPRQVHLGNGEYLTLDPKTWNPKRSITAQVGLGTGNRDEEAQRLMMVIQEQKQAMQMGLSTPANLYNAYERLVESMELKDASLYFTDPQSLEGQQLAQQRSQQAQAQQQAEQQLMQSQMQLVQAQNEIKRLGVMLKHQEAQAKLAADKEKVDKNTALELTKLEAENMAVVPDIPGTYIGQ